MFVVERESAIRGISGSHVGVASGRSIESVVGIFDAEMGALFQIDSKGKDTVGTYRLSGRVCPSFVIARSLLIIDEIVFGRDNGPLVGPAGDPDTSVFTACETVVIVIVETEAVLIAHHDLNVRRYFEVVIVVAT